MELMLTQYTIYVNPADMPGRFVVREWHITREMTEPEPGRSWQVNTLEQARELVPVGLVCIGRFADDDPVILETWT